MISLEFSVQDTGIGIKKEDLGKIFSKFERMDLARNSTVEGAGLGLAITRSLLEMMNGSIQVESAYGSGSVFRAVLPQKVVSMEPVGDFRHHILNNNLQNRTACRMSFRAPEARILAVDDTRINLMVTVGLLRDTGITIDTASCGAEAIKLAETTSYDLILMDQRMPEMDGVETIHRIRQGKGPNIHTPVICLTADAVAGARERYLSEGFTDYLSKPVNGEALEKAVIRYLPAEKVLPAEDLPKEAPDASGDVMAGDPDDGYAVLRQAGIDPASGLANSQGNHDLYRELLCEFAYDAGNKSENLQRCFEARNWKDYTVFVHALKSSARLIGAKKLSFLAAELEGAAKAEDEAAVLAGHSAMMEEYGRVTEAVRAAPFFTLPDDPDNEPEIFDFPAVT